MPIAPLTNDSKSNLLAKIAANTGETKPVVGDGEHNLLWKIAANTYSTASYRDWETDRKSTRLNSSHLKLSRMPSSA